MIILPLISSNIFCFYIATSDSDTNGESVTYDGYGQPTMTNTNQQKQNGNIQTWREPGIKIDVSRKHV